MASASITYRWPNEAVLHVEIDVDPTFPDAVDEARTQVVRLYRDACAVDRETPVEDEA